MYVRGLVSVIRAMYSFAPLLPYCVLPICRFPLEIFRTLLLTSFIGFLANECYNKILIAMFISLVFLCVFLWIRPCTFSQRHRIILHSVYA